MGNRSVSRDKGKRETNQVSALINVECHISSVRVGAYNSQLQSIDVLSVTRINSQDPGNMTERSRVREQVER